MSNKTIDDARHRNASLLNPSDAAPLLETLDSVSVLYVELERLRADLGGHDPCPSRVALDQAEREIARLQAVGLALAGEKLELSLELGRLRAALQTGINVLVALDYGDTALLEGMQRLLGQEESGQRG